MASVYTKLFGSGHVLLTSAAAIPVGTAPSDFVWVVRDVVIGNPTQALAQFHLYYNVTGGAVYLALVDVPITSSTHLDLRQVVPAGARIEIYSTALEYSYAVTGFELGEGASQN